MEILKNIDGEKLTIALAGRLDTNTTPALDAELKTVPDSVTDLEFDFEKLEYVSSAGLRVLLAAQKEAKKRGGGMKLKNVCDSVMEVFEITGFVDILTIE